MDIRTILLRKLKNYEILDANKIVEKFTKSANDIRHYISAAENLTLKKKLVKLGANVYLKPPNRKDEEIHIKEKLQTSIKNGKKVVLTGVKTDGTRYQEVVFPHEFKGEGNNKRVIVKKENNDGYRSYRLNLIFRIDNIM